MRVLVSGASGLIGSAVSAAMRSNGHAVVALTRSGTAPEPKIRWDPRAGELDADGLDGVEAVVHLAGEPLTGRWTADKKRRIRSSRVEGTRLLAEALASLANPPRVVLCASAVGYYGDRGDDVLDEGSRPGSGFLAEVCTAWEAAADPARAAGIRVAHLRFGIVLSAEGGALKQMLLPFRLGLGGVIGGGGQWWSWVLLEDVVAIALRTLDDEGIAGAVNVVAPEPVTCRTFVRTLGAVLRRPTVIPMPAFAARLALGEMADEALLASARVRPGVMLKRGFAFGHPELQGALECAVGRKAPGHRGSEL